MGLNFSPETIEKQIEFFKNYREYIDNFSLSLLKNKIIIINQLESGTFLISNLDDGCFYTFYKSIFFIDLGIKSCLVKADKNGNELGYGITDSGNYFKKDNVNKLWIYDKDKEEEYKKCFLEGK